MQRRVARVTYTHTAASWEEREAEGDLGIYRFTTPKKIPSLGVWELVVATPPRLGLEDLPWEVVEDYLRLQPLRKTPGARVFDLSGRIQVVPWRAGDGTANPNIFFYQAPRQVTNDNRSKVLHVETVREVTPDGR